jgi:hypothetical protein
MVVESDMAHQMWYSFCGHLLRVRGHFHYIVIVRAQ